MCTFTTSCPRCGEVSLVPEQIELRVVPNAVGEDFYAFTCPTCQEWVRKEADEGVSGLLRAGGVQPVERIDHPETPPRDRPPISHEDLRAFQRLLQRDDRLAAHLV